MLLQVLKAYLICNQTKERKLMDSKGHTIFEVFLKKREKRKKEFMEHVSEETKELIEEVENSKRKISKEEYKLMRINSYDRHLLIPYLDDIAFISLIDDYYLQASRAFLPLLEYELPQHYDEALLKVFFPLLIERFKGLIIKNGNMQK
jgi:hypothetical protein